MLVEAVMVPVAQQHQVVQVGGATVYPVLDVVRGGRSCVRLR